MNLTHITFTGIDERTDLDRVERISEQHPYVEWGILLSYHWWENGNRYPNPKILDRLEHRGLNLSAHFCGGMARDIAAGETQRMYKTINYQFDIFRRCQLNVNASSMYRALRTMRVFDRTLNEVILQMNSRESLGSFLHYMEEPTPHVAYLIDGSGGRGIDKPIEIYDNPDIHVGYAGGINPENVGAKLSQLLEHRSYGSFWIDMESGVRTDDWLDLDKVERVLEICEPMLTAWYKKALERLPDKHAIMTDKERYDYVSHSWLQCIKPITNIRKGRGCDAGEWYCFEYIHDTNDGEDPNAEPFYRKLSDNDHYDEVYITDTELRENFIKKD